MTFESISWISKLVFALWAVVLVIELVVKLLKYSNAKKMREAIHNQNREVHPVILEKEARYNKILKVTNIIYWVFLVATIASLFIPI